MLAEVLRERCTASLIFEVNLAKFQQENTVEQKKKQKQLGEVDSQQLINEIDYGNFTDVFRNGWRKNKRTTQIVGFTELSRAYLCKRLSEL